ncbi:MAG TPA: pyrroline-5-carboxylate reductase [Nitrospirota bacterium]|jgi:pyrroline-5-carboxylate reductase
MDKSIAFIGAGNMAEAMVRGLVTAGSVRPDAVAVSDASNTRLLHMKKTYDVHANADNKKAAKGRDIVVLSVKPQVMDAVLKELSAVITAKQLVVSIAAGVTVERIEDGLGKKPRVVRVMPNTPALIGQGAAAMYMGANCKPGDSETAGRLLGAVCPVVVTVGDERLMDAVTGLSGSGPAYIFVMLEAMSDAGVRMGLPRADAFRLAAQTMLGAAGMAVATGDPLCKLKDMVTSPGGTTISGLASLEEAGLRNALYKAIESATLRSRELGKS